MSRPRYAIGIDLGTTNCVLAYVDLAVKRGRVSVLPIPQLQTRDTVAAGPLLPSFYYLGTEAHEPPCIVPGLHPTAALGVYARAQLDAVPGRVIHSAKSWLAHGGIDREARLLPFGSEEISDTDKRSPVEVSAAYLAYLRAAWDATMGQADPGAAFDRQHLIVTVPASFDEAAQALTRQAAALAGYPDGFRLLEEPQAAFYAWSAGVGAGAAGKGTRGWFTERLPRLSEEAQTVLVCDIGGGTTDLSLFRLALDPDAPGEDPEWPDIERIAVSDHLLLGGDNIDLAIAHLIEARALGHSIRGQSIRSGPERRLSRRQWQHLVPQSMRLKERILSGEGPPEEVFHVSIPGEGGDLFASVLSATLTRADLSAVILDGFFPITEAGERPRTRQMGLREIGLPYAVDTAVSRHLAGFLDGQAVDAVLFAGGTLIPRFLQERLLTIVERWQGRRPIGLYLPDLNLAIAEGAAHCAALVAESRRRIRAGYARSVYLELYRERPEDATELVCILPQGFEEGRSFTLESRSFDLLLNRPARFTAYSSTHRREDRPGAIVRLDEGVFNPLPPLHTTLTLSDAGFDPRKSEARSVDVNLEVELTPLGVLQTMLVSEPLGRRWRLDFNLRAAVESRDPSGPASGLSDDVVRPACERIAHFYGKKQDLGEKDSAKSLIRDLERILGQPRTVWSLPLLRGLWPSLYPGMTRRGRSLAHENTWLYLAGFLLRPGYGAELDPWRMSQLWGAWSLGVHHKKEKSAQSNWWMMWRRVAGGLSAEQQRRLFDALLPQFRKSPLESPEATRLLGALERLPLTIRTELAKSLFELVLRGRAEDQPAVFWALARLCSRVPLYAAADAVLPPALIEGWFERVAGLDWPRQGLKGLTSVFIAACRVTGTRALDIHAPVRLRVIEKLKDSGARESDWRVVQEYHEVTGEDRNALFGEELPAGLRLLQ